MPKGMMPTTEAGAPANHLPWSVSHGVCALKEACSHVVPEWVLFRNGPGLNNSCFRRKARTDQKNLHNSQSLLSPRSQNPPLFFSPKSISSAMELHPNVPALFGTACSPACAPESLRCRCPSHQRLASWSAWCRSACQRRCGRCRPWWHGWRRCGVPGWVSPSYPSYPTC